MLNGLGWRPAMEGNLAEDLKCGGISDRVEGPGQGEEGLGVARAVAALTKFEIRWFYVNKHKSLGRHCRL